MTLRDHNLENIPNTSECVDECEDSFEAISIAGQIFLEAYFDPPMPANGVIVRVHVMPGTAPDGGLGLIAKVISREPATNMGTNANEVRHVG